MVIKSSIVELAALIGGHGRVRSAFQRSPWAILVDLAGRRLHCWFVVRKIADQMSIGSLFHINRGRECIFPLTSNSQRIFSFLQELFIMHGGEMRLRLPVRISITVHPHSHPIQQLLERLRDANQLFLASARLHVLGLIHFIILLLHL